MALSRRIFSLGNRPNFRWQHVAQARLLKDETGDHHADPDAVAAFGIAGRTYHYFFNHFGRDSFNNGGRSIDVYLHRGRQSKVAQFHHKPNQDLVTMGDGDGSTFRSTMASPDVLAHELTHGYMQYLATLRYGLSDAGAILEHLCDVFAWLIRHEAPGTPTTWEIGAGYPVNKRALRDFDNPGDSTLAMPGAPHVTQMRTYTGQADLYFNAGVLGKAFAISVTTLGAARRNDVGEIWFRVAEHLPSEGTFAQFRAEVVSVARQHFPDTAQPISDAFTSVGL